jgi:hypothetical protein
MNNCNENREINPDKNSELEQQSNIEDTLILKRENLITKLAEIDDAINYVNEEYNSKIQDLRDKKKPIEEALYHIEALLRIEGHNLNQASPSQVKYRGPKNLVTTSIVDAVFNILEEIHRPTHYKELTYMLQEKNIYIPGKDPAATLLSRVNRDKRFKRAGKRGVYALSNWRISKTNYKSAKRHKKK